MKKAVVVGGGVGGTIVANALARRFDRDEVEITVISESSKHLYLPGLISVAMGQHDPDWVSKDERSLLSGKIRFIQSPAERILPKESQVLVEGNSYNYDYLVIATGSRLVPEDVPGYSTGALHFYDVDGALKVRDAVSSFTGGTIVVGVASVPYKCPPAPLEFTYLLDEYFRRKGIREKVTIEYLYPINGVFPIRTVEPMLAKILEERNVTVRTFFNTESIDPVTKEVTSLEGETVKYDLLVMVPPHRGSKLIEESGMGDRGGWLATDRYTLKVQGYDNIYAVGDATDIPISKAGSTAHYEARVVSDRLTEELQGAVESEKKYNGHVFCFLETGYGKGLTLDFDYDHAPKPSKPGSIAHWEKIILNKLYWSTVPKARV